MTNNYDKMTGAELQQEYEEQGINALWIKGRGMIYMTSYYGVDIAVSGTYPLYSREVAARALARVMKDLAAGDTNATQLRNVERWLCGHESGRKYTVR